MPQQCVSNTQLNSTSVLYTTRRWRHGQIGNIGEASGICDRWRWVYSHRQLWPRLCRPSTCQNHAAASWSALAHAAPAVAPRRWHALNREKRPTRRFGCAAARFYRRHVHFARCGRRRPPSSAPREGHPRGAQQLRRNNMMAVSKRCAPSRQIDQLGAWLGRSAERTSIGADPGRQRGELAMCTHRQCKSAPFLPTYCRASLKAPPAPFRRASNGALLRIVASGLAIAGARIYGRFSVPEAEHSSRPMGLTRCSCVRRAHLHALRCWRWGLGAARRTGEQRRDAAPTTS